MLDRILAPVPNWLGRGAEVQPGSRLASDDAATSPVQMSHVTRACLTQAVDHLEALRQWIFVARVVPTWATFTVARGAIENAATAVWLQSNDDQSVRVRRRIKVRVRDIRHGQDFMDHLGDPPPRPAEQRLEELVTMGRAFGVDRGDVLGRTVGYRAILAEAGRETPVLSDDGPLAMWRMCSGVAHGQQWATLGVLEREIVATDGDVVQVRLTASEKPLVGAVNMAARLTAEGFRLLDRHRLCWRDSACSPTGPDGDRSPT